MHLKVRLLRNRVRAGGLVVRVVRITHVRGDRGCVGQRSTQVRRDIGVDLYRVTRPHRHRPQSKRTRPGLLAATINRVRRIGEPIRQCVRQAHSRGIAWPVVGDDDRVRICVRLSSHQSVTRLLHLKVRLTCNGDDKTWINVIAVFFFRWALIAKLDDKTHLARASGKSTAHVESNRPRAPVVVPGIKKGARSRLGTPCDWATTPTSTMQCQITRITSAGINLELCRDNSP